jgi:hypothetical protein
MERRQLPSTEIMKRSFLAVFAICTSAGAAPVDSAPANGAANVNPDTHLVLRFAGPPHIGNAGTIRIYDAADDRLVDELDMSVPAGPTERASGPYPPYLATPYDYGGPGRTYADTKPGSP